MKKCFLEEVIVHLVFFEIKQSYGETKANQEKEAWTDRFKIRQWGEGLSREHWVSQLSWVLKCWGSIWEDQVSKDLNVKDLDCLVMEFELYHKTIGSIKL